MESQGINIETTCSKCVDALELFGERCLECQEVFDTNQTILAHELVDEGNDEYRYFPMYTPMLKVIPEPSGHDWVAPLTRTPKGEREEYLEPTTSLADRPFEPSDEAMIPLVTIGQDEAVCNWCHLTFLARRNTCPTCEMADN
jgi:hypothetical protein